MTNQQQYVLTLRLDGANPQYELAIDNDCTTLASTDPDDIRAALRIALQMTEGEAEAAVSQAIAKSETYTLYKGMDSALPAMVLLHAWGVAPMRLAVYHRGRCRRQDPRPIMVCPLDQGYPAAPLVCPNCGKMIERQRALAFSFIVEA